MRNTTGTTSQPTATTLDALQVTFRGEQADNYKPVSSQQGESATLAVTEGLIDLLSLGHSDSPGGSIPIETLRNSIWASQRCARAALSQISQTIANFQEKAESGLSKKELACLRKRMLSIRTQLSNVKEYGCGDQYKTKKDAVKEAFSKLVTCLMMYKTVAEFG
jgi:hypothetical protein